MTEERSPWKGAAVGAGGGSLLAAALGYIYGHRGKWLAYDALTGGALGGGLGYGVEKFNKDRIEGDNKKNQDSNVQYWGNDTNSAFDKEHKDRQKEIIGQSNRNREGVSEAKAGFLGDLDPKGSRAYNTTKAHSKFLQDYKVPEDWANAIARVTSAPQRGIQYLFGRGDGRKKLSTAEMLAAGLMEDPKTESGYRATDNPVRDLGTYALEKRIKSLKEKLKLSKQKVPDTSSPYDNMMDAYLGK